MPIGISTQHIQPTGAEQYQPLQPEQCFGNPRGDCFRHAHHSHVRVRRSAGVLTELVDMVAAIVTQPDHDHPHHNNPDTDVGHYEADTRHYKSDTRHYEVNAACYEDDCAHHSGACEADCAHHCDCETASFWEHRSGMFADYLYLSAGGVDLPYATPVDGFGALSVPIGSVAIADPDHESGFRVGGVFAIDADSSIVATFWNFESGTKDSFALPGGTGFVRSDLTHPNTSSVASDSLAASADYGIEFQNVDLAYKSILYAGDAHSLNYFLGVRYTRLEQQLAATYSILGTTSVLTNIDFDGVGPQLGLESERLLGHGFLLFARGTANFLVGEFRADYQQFNTLALTQAVAGFEDDRLVTQLELELGLGWENSSGRLSVRAGYYRAGWFNTVTTPTFVNAVQSGSFDDVDDTLTFDGLTLRTEFRF